MLGHTMAPINFCLSSWGAKKSTGPLAALPVHAGICRLDDWTSEQFHVRTGSLGAPTLSFHSKCSSLYFAGEHVPNKHQPATQQK